MKASAYVCGANSAQTTLFFSLFILIFIVLTQKSNMQRSKQQIGKHAKTLIIARIEYKARSRDSGWYIFCLRRKEKKCEGGWQSFDFEDLC